MPAPDTAFAIPLGAGSLARPDGAAIAYHRLEGSTPGIVFLGGFRSDLTGTKALFLADYCHRRGHADLRFGYFGQGRSSADFAAASSDRAVRWRRSRRVAERRRGRAIVVTLVKDGDHRLSSDADLARLAQILDGLLAA